MEHRRVRITSYASSSSPEHLAALHPFTQQERRFISSNLAHHLYRSVLPQLDVVFPSSDVLESALSKLGTRYFKGRAKLSEIVDYAVPLASSLPDPNIPFTALSVDGHGDDVWCIDPRGLLTLSLSKDTYERLGLVGKKLPFKHHSDTHVVRLPLQQHAESVANRTKRNEALRAWDARREERGLEPWDVLLCFQDSASAPSIPQFISTRDVQCQITKLAGIRIPAPTLSHHLSTLSQDDSVMEDWNANMAALYEWVGMACLGSQRLSANDRVDPYVSVYEGPEPSYVGDVTHLRWTGFLGPAFVRSVINAAVMSINSLSTATGNKPFVAITAHAISASPVSYIPSATQSASWLHGPMRLPRRDGEDTWCVLAGPGAVGSQPLVNWSLVESLGQYDARWG